MADAELALAVALARELLHRSGALRVSIALASQPPAVIECARRTAIVVREAGGEERALAHDAYSDVRLPDLPLMRQLPPFEVDAADGRVAGVLGGLEMLGRAVRDVTGLLGDASVVAAEYETSDPDTPLAIAARPGEPLIVLLGEHEFELEPDVGA